MRVSERSVQRSLSRLRQKKLLRQIRERQEDGSVRYYHDLSGLRAQLERLARRDIQYSEILRAGRAGHAQHGLPGLKEDLPA
jgi:DNA-binding transcriptional ArsR family regulator